MTGLQDVFKYRSFVITAYRVIFWVLLLVCAIIVRINILDVADKEWYQAGLKLVLSMSVPLSILVRLHLIIRPRVFSSYVLGDDKILQRFKNKTKEIQFSSVKEIKISWLSPRFFGGFTLMLNTGQKFVFLSLLENNHVILEKLVASNAELLKGDRLERYIKMARLVKISWQRIFRRAKAWPALVVKFLGYPLIIANLLHSSSKNFVLTELPFENILYLFCIASMLNFIVFMVINHFEEKILNSKVQAELGDLKVNEQWEKLMTIAAQVGFYFLTGAIYYLVL